MVTFPGSSIRHSMAYPARQIPAVRGLGAQCLDGAGWAEQHATVSRDRILLDVMLP